MRRSEMLLHFLFSFNIAGNSDSIGSCNLADAMTGFVLPVYGNIFATEEALPWG
jgi:hypothetical protein